MKSAIRILKSAIVWLLPLPHRYDYVAAGVRHRQTWWTWLGREWLMRRRVAPRRT